MTLPVGTISMSQVNTELGLASTTNISLNQANVRTLAGVGGSGTIISMDDLRGKTYFALAFSPAVNFDGTAQNFGAGAYAVFRFYSNGAIDSYSGDYYNSTSNPTSYGSPLTAGIGSGYEFSVDIATYSYGGPYSYIYIGNDFPYTPGGTYYNGVQTTPWIPLTSRVDFGANAGTFTSAVSLVTTGTIRIRQISTGTIISQPYSLSLYATD